MQNTSDPVKFVELSVGKIAYTLTGSGPPIVLLPAAGHDRHDFDEVVGRLSQTHQVIAPDWPGWGDSTGPAEPRTATAMLYADVLREFVRTLRLENVILVGNSVGGYAATRLALDEPTRVRALVLVNSGGFTPPSFVGRNFVRLRGAESFNRLTWNWFPGRYTKERGPGSRRMLERIRASETDTRVQILAALWRSFNAREHDLRDRASAIKVPTLLVWGAKDPVIPAAVGRAAARSIPGSRLKLLPTGHVAFVENPALFLETLTPFLEQLP